MKPTLLVLAAGMGSRFGGMKQMEPVGPSGEWILDYSVYDALQAGFGKIVFVIRKEMEADFKDAVASKYSGIIPTVCCFQSLDDLPAGFTVPEGRQKPWGTGHAVLAARHEIKEPFAVINADDFYGREAYLALAKAFSANSESSYTLVGYKLSNTLSDKGSVSRGICKADSNGQLITVEEHSEIQSQNGSLQGKNPQGETVNLSGDEIVSLNCWGFEAKFFSSLQNQFESFMADQGTEAKSEFYLPTAVDHQASQKEIKVEVVACGSQWIGMTHRDDLVTVKCSISKLIDDKTYPSPLWH
ncbi:NTP transferase domain-containing protein [Puniceicoccaceae bacterium K14]|nr:NTP transferase domain-containing protein [Puniceicoccaceae bacterium K14]